MADVLPPPEWTMSVTLSRKRSRLALGDDDDELQLRREPSPAPSAISDTLKRSRTQCELDELNVVSPEEAWCIDLEALLSSNCIPKPPGSNLEPHNNWAKYQKGQSILVLCVQGNVHTHYDLLW